MKEDLFAALYLKYYRQVCRYLLGLGVPPNDVPDLAQQTYVRVLRHMNEYRGEGQWTYLKKVARNIAYNELRERKAQKRAGDVESFEALPDPDSSLITYETPEIELEQRERAERLVAAIERLQPKTQECLLLWLNGATYEEIAEILSLTLSAVKTRLRDARKTLVTRVNDEIS